MTFHDSVKLVMDVPFDPPRYDYNGFEIFDHVEETVPAEVFALDTDHVLSASRDIVTSRYGMVLAPQVDIPPLIGTGLRIEWDAFVIDPNDPSTGLYVDGTVERHMLRGRLHHYELITRNMLA